MAHERALWTIEAQNSFSIGATSHVAEVAFDKYALFCQEYVGEMFRTLTTLTRDGPGQTALPHASSLLEIRRKWALWLTPTLEIEWEPFETALRKIGADAYRLEHAPGEPGTIKEMYSLFAKVLGFERWEDKLLTGDVTVIACD
jgi:hypothetical protein